MNFIHAVTTLRRRATLHFLKTRSVIARMIPRRLIAALTSALTLALAEALAAALLVPRQVGKTILAFKLANTRLAVRLDLESSGN